MIIKYLIEIFDIQCSNFYLQLAPLFYSEILTTDTKLISSELLPLKNYWIFSKINMGFSEMVETPASMNLCLKKKGPR